MHRLTGDIDKRESKSGVGHGEEEQRYVADGDLLRGHHHDIADDCASPQPREMPASFLYFVGMPRVDHTD